MTRALVTGANGFIGSALCRHLSELGWKIRAAVRGRTPPSLGSAACEYCSVGDIHGQTDWESALNDIEVVVHLAARVHVLRERAQNPLAEFIRVNTAGTERLASQAAFLGVRRLVYVSSIAVNGQSTRPGQMFAEEDDPRPADPYGLSKLGAESVLSAIAARSALEVVIIRPPAVYGPDLRGHLRTLLSYVHRGIPLPLANIRNRRSFISLDNLCRFLSLCSTHPSAVGQTFLLADERAISTPELYTLLSEGMGRRPRLYPLPEPVLRFSCSLCGLQNIHRRLCHSLVIDCGKATRVLDWHAPNSVEDGLERTAKWYIQNLQQREKEAKQECLVR